MNKNSLISENNIILVLMVSLLILDACSVKKIAKETYKPEKITKNFVEENNRNYNSVNRVWFKKFSGVFEASGKKQKFKGNIRLVKDSLMIISLASNMGVEGFRIFLRRDSVFVVNRLKATYFDGPVTYFKDDRLRILNFDVLQDILLVNSKRLFSTNAKAEPEKINQMSLICYKNKDADYQAFTSNNKLIARKICYRSIDGVLTSGDFIFSEWNENIKVFYPEYSQYENIRLPVKIILESTYRNQTEKLELNFGKTVINLPFPAGIKIGSKYKRVKSFNEL